LAALYPDLAERLRLAGMLNYDKRRKERKKVFFNFFNWLEGENEIL